MFPLLTVAENLAMGAYTRSDAGVEEDLEMVLGYFPVLRERLRQTAGTLAKSAPDRSVALPVAASFCAPASLRMAARQPPARGPEQAPLQSGASPR